MVSDPALRFGLRVALTPWVVFVAGLAIDWHFSFVGAVFASLFVMGPKPMPSRYCLSLVAAGFVYMITAWFIAMAVRPYPGAFLLLVILGVTLSYYLLVTRKDILLAVMALLGALLIPQQVRGAPDLAWALAIWIPGNVLIAFVVSWFAFKLLPPSEENSPPSAQPDFDPMLRWFKLSAAMLPLVVFAFVTVHVSSFTLTYLAVQLTQFAAQPSNGPNMIKGAMIGNIIGGAMAVVVYEVAVIAPLMVVVASAMLVGFAILSKRQTEGDPLAATAMTAFTVVCGVSFGPIMDDAEGKIFTRLSQIVFAMGYVFSAIWLLEKWFPETQSPTKNKDSEANSSAM